MATKKAVKKQPKRKAVIEVVAVRNLDKMYADKLTFDVQDREELEKHRKALPEFNSLRERNAVLQEMVTAARNDLRDEKNSSLLKTVRAVRDAMTQILNQHDQ